MATTTTLRVYLDDLNGMIEAGSTAKVIPHCRHILKHYPQNVATYRLLAIALRDRGERDNVATHYDEALDTFHRVLSVLPLDFRAHREMSRIRLLKGQISEAIWHLERAYEQQPSNQAVQETLRELYAQKSGSPVKGKIQLTSAALAHQYIIGQLFDQALIELRSALRETPQRIDLQLLLAETMWETHHQVEASELAVALLKKLPYCLGANRILARLWLQNERPSDAQLYLNRIEAVDPYAARAILQPNSKAPDTNILPQLDVDLSSAADLTSETPTWLDELGDTGSSLGDLGPGPFDVGAEAVPFDSDAPFGEEANAQAPADPFLGADVDWASSENAATGADEPEAEFADWLSELPGTEEASEPQPSAAAPDWPDAATEDMPDVDDFMPAAASEDAAEPADIPDWLGDAAPAAEASDSTPDDAALFDDFMTDAASEDAAEPADIPDWLGEAAPAAEPSTSSSATDDSASFDDFLTQTAAETDMEPSSVPDWLRDAGPASDQSQPDLENAPDFDDFLTDFESATESETAMSSEPELPSFDDLMADAASDDDEPPADTIPDWLAEPSDLELAAAQETSSPTEDDDDPFAVLDQAVADTAADNIEHSRSSSGFTEILAGVDDRPTQPDSDEPEPTPPAWLSASDADESSTSEPAEESTSEAEPQSDSFDTFAEEDGDLQETETQDEPEFLTLVGADLDIETIENDAAQAVDIEPEPAPLAEADDALDWMAEPEYDFFAPEQDAPDPAQDALDTAAQDVTPPEWLPSAASEAAEAPDDTAASVADDWLNALDEVDETGLEEVPMAADTPGDTEDKIPDEQPAPDAVPDDDWYSETDDEALFAALADPASPVEQPEEADEFAQFEDIEPSADSPDWLAEAVPEPLADHTSPTPDDELERLFDTPAKQADAESGGWDTVDSNPDLSLDDETADGDTELDWLRAEATEEDWLGALSDTAAVELTDETESASEPDVDDMADLFDEVAASESGDEALELDTMFDSADHPDEQKSSTADAQETGADNLSGMFDDTVDDDAFASMFDERPAAEFDVEADAAAFSDFESGSEGEPVAADDLADDGSTWRDTLAIEETEQPANSDEPFVAAQEDDSATLVLPPSDFEARRAAAVQDQDQAAFLPDTPSVADTNTDDGSSFEERVAEEPKSAVLARLGGHKPTDKPDETKDDSIDGMLAEPYDPFQGGSEDQVPHYSTAQRTGILQPNENPDWMGAFTGEDLPPEPKSEQDLGATRLLGVEDTEADDSGATRLLEDTAAEDWADSETAEQEDADTFAEDADEADIIQYAAEDDAMMSTISTEADEEAEDDGPMPSWLLEITQSEADKLDPSLIAEPEPEPDIEPSPDDDDDMFLAEMEDDWLAASEDTASAAPVATEAAEDTEIDLEAALDLFDGDTDSDDIAFDAAFETPLVDELTFAEPEEEPFEFDTFSESEEDDFALFDAGEIEADSEPAQALAEPADLSHTREDESDSVPDTAHDDEAVPADAAADIESAPDEDDEFSFAKNEDDVPDDFGFDEVIPVWLRRPKEQASTDQNETDSQPDSASQTPEWLRDVFEEDNDDIEN